MDTTFKAIEEAMLRAALFQLAVAIAITILMFWLTYLVIKAGVRDGIRESGLRAPATTERPAPAGYRWTLTKDFEDTKPLTID